MRAQLLIVALVISGALALPAARQGAALYLGTGDARPVEIGADGTPYLRVSPGGGIATLNGAALAVTAGNIPYAGALYTASGGQTWTVEEADQQFYTYGCVGKLCTVGFSFFTTTVSGNAVTLTAALPAALTPAQTTNAAATGRNAGTLVHTRAFVVAGEPFLSIQQVDGANWGAATNTTTLRGSITFLIQ